MKKRRMKKWNKNHRKSLTRACQRRESSKKEDLLPILLFQVTPKNKKLVQAHQNQPSFRFFRYRLLLTLKTELENGGEI